MVAVNEDAKGTAYTVSCDAAIGVSTGISATDRALTARILADPQSTPSSIPPAPGIFSRCGRLREECVNARDTRKQPWICVGLPDLLRWV